MLGTFAGAEVKSLRILDTSGIERTSSAPPGWAMNIEIPNGSIKLGDTFPVGFEIENSGGTPIVGEAAQMPSKDSPGLSAILAIFGIGLIVLGAGQILKKPNITPFKRISGVTILLAVLFIVIMISVEPLSLGSLFAYISLYSIPFLVVLVLNNWWAILLSPLAYGIAAGILLFADYMAHDSVRAWGCSGPMGWIFIAFIYIALPMIILGGIALLIRRLTARVGNRI